MSLRELCELSAAADDSIWFTCWCNCEDSSAIIVTAGIDETIRLHSFTQNENDTASIAALLPAQKTISMNNALGCTSLIASPLQDTRSFVYSAWMDGTIRAIDTNSINSSTESTKLPPKKDWIIECGAGAYHLTHFTIYIIHGVMWFGGLFLCAIHVEVSASAPAIGIPFSFIYIISLSTNLCFAFSSPCDLIIISVLFFVIQEMFGHLHIIREWASLPPLLILET